MSRTGRPAAGSDASEGAVAGTLLAEVAGSGQRFLACLVRPGAASRHSFKMA